MQTDITDITDITDEYGVPTVQQDSVGTGQPFLLTSEPYDDETSLLYLRARFDDPAMGGWTQQHPQVNSLDTQAWNLRRIL